MRRLIAYGCRHAAFAAVIMSGFACLTPAAAQSAGQWRDGQHVYAKICANCHDTGVGPVLKGRNIRPFVLRRNVRQGKMAMPAFRSTEIDDNALNQVAEMLFKSEAPAQGGGK